MKKVLIVLSLCLLLLGIGGCMSPEEKEAQNQIMSYLDEINALQDDQVNIINDIMVIENSDDEEEILSLLTDSTLPALESINSALAAIETPNEELAAVHKYLTDGWQELTNGVEVMTQALQDNDLDKVEEGNTAVTSSQNKINQYYSELETLCEKYNIELEITDSETES